MYSIIIKYPKDPKCWIEIAETLQKTCKYSYSVYEESFYRGRGKFVGTSRYLIKIYTSINGIIEILPFLQFMSATNNITFEKEDNDLQETLFIDKDETDDTMQDESDGKTKLSKITEEFLKKIPQKIVQYDG